LIEQRVFFTHFYTDDTQVLWLQQAVGHTVGSVCRRA